MKEGNTDNLCIKCQFVIGKQISEELNKTFALVMENHTGLQWICHQTPYSSHSFH